MNQTDRPPHEEQILRQRAAKYAQMAEDTLEQKVIDTVVVLAVGDQKIGISIGGIDVIVKTPPIAHLPQLPPLIKGVLQIRAELIAAVDIGRWLDIDTSGEAPFLALISDSNGKKVGLLVDGVLGFQDLVEGDMVESFFINNNSNGHPVWGTTKDLVAVIDLGKLLKSPEITIDRKNRATKNEVRRI